MIEPFSSCTIGLQKCECFEKLNEQEQQFLNAHSASIHYRKGEIICKQGGMASHIMYMKKGLSKVYLENGSTSLIIKLIPEGNLLGLTSVSSRHTTFQYSAMAYVDSEVTQIDITAFRQVLNSNAAFASSVIDILSANSVQINGRFFCLTQKQSFGRLADILICLSDRIFQKTEFDLPLTRKDVAELSGLRPETVMRMLKKFQDEGLISFEGKKMMVLDYQRLKQISDRG